MKNEPKISIIVPLYNAEKFIDRCMESIYAQTFTDIEIILVNDGSKDKSGEICRSYAQKDERVRVIEKENEGAGSARNRGIVEAKGEYLYFPDVDDWFEPEMLEELYAVAAEGDYDEVFSGANFYGQQGDELVYSRSANCEEVRYMSREECRQNVMTFFPTSTIFDVPWNKLYKRSVCIENGVRFSDTRRCQDAMFNIDFYNSVKKVASVSKSYYNYIENTSADVQRKFPKNYIDINFAYFDKLKGILSSWGVYEGKIKQHYDTSFVLAVYGAMEMMDNPRWNMSKSEKKDYVQEIMARPVLQQFLISADIREDAFEQARILREQDYASFMKEHNREKLKEAIRKTFLIKIYRKIRDAK